MGHCSLLIVQQSGAFHIEICFCDILLTFVCERKKITRISTFFLEINANFDLSIGFLWLSNSTNCSQITTVQRHRVRHFFLHRHINQTTWRMWNDVKFINTDKHRKYNIKTKCRLCISFFFLIFQMNCDKME